MSASLIASEDAVCRGDWLLGTACGKCRRCLETAPHAIAVLKKDVEKVRRLRHVVSRDGDEQTLDFKTSQLAEARRIIWED